MAWVEFPYRVRRRTETIPQRSVASRLGHDIQERLACHQAWIATEHPPVAAAYEKARETIGPAIGAATTEAWNTAPISTAAQMNFGDWDREPLVLRPSPFSSTQWSPDSEFVGWLLG